MLNLFPVFFYNSFCTTIFLKQSNSFNFSNDISDTPCVFGLLGGARFDWDFYVDGFKVEEFINGPFDDPLSCFFYIEQNIPGTIV